MEEESILFPDPETLMYQALIDRIKTVLAAPYVKIISVKESLRNRLNDLSQDIQNYMIKNTIYDLEYQYKESQNN